MENFYFICANNSCNSIGIGGEHILLPEDGSDMVQCPSCGQKYQFNEQKNTFALFDEEAVVINSLKDYSTKAQQFTNKDLYITKLHLKGIADSENFNKIIAYEQCFIDTLVIEDVNLQTGCFPFNFDHCYINHLHIVNSKISKSVEKDFWGPDVFFGLNFNESEIYESFTLDNYTGDMLIRNCTLPETINIDNCNIQKLHFINNNKPPKLAVNNSQIADQIVLFDKFKTEEGLQNDIGSTLKNTKKLVLTSELTAAVGIKNQHIDELVFTEKESFDAPIQITNCVINSVLLNSVSFKQKLRFFNCRFISPVTFTEASFHKSLVLESCFFDDGLVMNEITVGGDVHLSYSSFAGNLLINQSEISAYLSMHQSNVSGLFSLGYSKVGHNITLVNNTFNSVKFKTITVNENTFFRNCRIINGCNIEQNQFGGDLSFTTCIIDTDLSINTSNIQGDLRISDSLLLRDTSVMMNEITKDVFITQTSFAGSTDFTFNRLSKFLTYSNRFFSYFMQKDETVNSSYTLNNNICYNNYTLARLKLFDQDYSNNLIFGRLDLDDIDGKDIVMNANTLTHFEITNSVCGRFEFSKGSIQNLFVNDLHASGKFVFRDVKFTGKNYIHNSRFDKFVLLANSHFLHSSFMLKNRMSSIEIANNKFKCNACFFNNFIETSFAAKNNTFDKVLDMNGSFVTGSATFSANIFNDALVLDNTFFDKRLDFLQSDPGWISYCGATFKGFNMPASWDMKKGRLVSKTNANKPVIIDELMHLEKSIPVEPTFQMHALILFEEHEKFQSLQSSWQSLKSTILQHEEEIEKNPKELHEVLNLFFEYKWLVDISLENNFAPLYYGYVDMVEIEGLQSACDISVSYLSELETSGPEMKSLADFCLSFKYLSSAFLKPDNEAYLPPKASKQKSVTVDRLKDQYLTTKEIYGGNGDLGFEDKAYFRWMHYKSLADLQNSNGLKKLSVHIKRLVFEKIFGWGVDLFRIFGSTLLTVLLFSGIYWVGGQLNSGLSILWDDKMIPIAALNYGNILLLTFQTTFAAFMGDWSPAGLGAMKIWMTINAIIGVLLVAFLIGAYGRKMLR